MRIHRALAVALTALLFAFFLASAATALPAATTVQVNDSTSDAPLSSEGRTSSVCESTDATAGCTLRAAVELADGLSIVSTWQVTVEVPAGTYTNTTADGRELTIAAGANVRIVGAGAPQTIIDGGGDGSAIYVKEPEATLTLEGVTVSDGSEFAGGGIYAEGKTAVRLVNATITGNEASAGGGIYMAPEKTVRPGAPSTKQSQWAALKASPPVASNPGLSLVDSTIARNRAAMDGGGIYIANGDVNEIVNSTIAENEAEGQGGGLAASSADVLLSMDTLVDNSAEASPDSGNIVEGEPAEVLLHQTLMAEPAASRGPGCEGTGIYRPESAEYNLDYPSTRPGAGEFDACGLSEELRHDLVGADPRLETSGPTDNGGETGTIAPLGGYSATPSPAVDTVPLAQCGEIGEGGIDKASADQRGSPRPDPNGDDPEPDCDIGAYEFAATIVAPTCPTPAAANAGEQVTVLCTIEKSEGLFATGATASFTLPASATLISATPSQGSCTGTSCQLGTIDPATVSIVLTPSASGALAFTASDKERGANTTSVPIAVKTATPPTPVAPKRPHECSSKRSLDIHLESVKRLKIASAVVYVNKRRRRVIHGKALRAAIDLHGLPKGTVKIRIVARTASGKRLIGVRIYDTCGERQPLHEHLLL